MRDSYVGGWYDPFGDRARAAIDSVVELPDFHERHLNWCIGQVMKASGGCANPVWVMEELVNRHGHADSPNGPRRQSEADTN